jgi:hypothetical protein
MPQFRVVVPPNVSSGQVVRASVGRGYVGASGGGGGGGGASKRVMRAPANNPPAVSVRVPDGAMPGDAFIFDLSQEQLDELLQASLSAGGEGGASSSKSSTGRSGAGTASSPSSSAWSTAPPITQTRCVLILASEENRFRLVAVVMFTHGRGILFGLLRIDAVQPPTLRLNRLVSYTDSFNEVLLGFLIGMSMVVGFFAGVLYVTDPL